MSRLFWHMAKHELKLLQREGSATLTLLTLTVAVALAGWLGAVRTQQQARSTEWFQQAEIERLNLYRARAARMEQQLPEGGRGPIPVYEFTWGPRKPLWPAAWAPLSAVLPPGPLAVAFAGQSDLYPQAFAGWTREAVAESTENPLQMLVGRLDLGLVLLFLLPLLAIALGHDLISGEDENGTLAQVLAQPVTLGALLAAKLAARAALLLGPWLALSTLAVWTTPPGLDAPGVALRWAWFCLASVLYVAFWLLLAAAVNLRFRRTETSALVLAGAWLALLVVVPSAAGLLAASAYPVPSRAEFVEARRATDEASKEIPEREALTAFFAAHPDLPADLSAYPPDGRPYVTAHARREARLRQHEEISRRFALPLERQRRLITCLSFLSPVLGLREALAELAGTGHGRYEHFLSQARGFHQATTRYFYPPVFHVREFPAEAYDRVPRFHYQEEAAHDVVSRALPSLLPLALVTLVLAAWVVMAALRPAPR